MKNPSLKRNKTNNNSSRKTCFVFFIGDEGGILVHLKGNTVLKRLFSATVDIDNSKMMRQVIESDPKAPIYLLVDMMDQSYVNQTLPPVTKFSVQKLINRRLERDFSPEDIKGSLSLGREKDGRRDWNYLLISLANSPQLIEWLEFIFEFDNRFIGIYLVPVEGEGFIKQLSKKIIGDDDPSQWQFLVLHNKAGGFRQIIIRNGKLTFTRLAQAVGDNSPEVVAGNIEQEVMNTVEYLKRLSYNENDGLDIMIIVSEEIKNAIDPTRIKAKRVETLTPHQAAEALSLEQAALPEDHYADVVFSSFFGKTRKKNLTLHTKTTKKLHQLYITKKYSLITAFSALALSAAVTAFTVIGAIPLMEEQNLIESKTSQIRKKLSSLEEETQKLPADLSLINDVVSIYEVFENKKHFPLRFIERFIPILPDYVVVRSYQWNSPQSLMKRFKGEDELINITLDIEFLNNRGAVEEFQQQAQDFFNAVRAEFPEYYFNHSKLPGIIEKTETFETRFDGENPLQSTLYLDGSPIFVTLNLTTEDPNERAKNARGRRR